MTLDAGLSGRVVVSALRSVWKDHPESATAPPTSGHPTMRATPRGKNAT